MGTTIQLYYTGKQIEKKLGMIDIAIGYVLELIQTCTKDARWGTSSSSIFSYFLGV